MEKYCFGIDVGGTTVKCGLFTVEGDVLDKWEIKTRVEDNGVAILPDRMRWLGSELAFRDRLTKRERFPVR